MRSKTLGMLIFSVLIFVLITVAAMSGADVWDDNIVECFITIEDENGVEPETFYYGQKLYLIANIVVSLPATPSDITGNGHYQITWQSKPDDEMAEWEDVGHGDRFEIILGEYPMWYRFVAAWSDE